MPSSSKNALSKGNESVAKPLQHYPSLPQSQRKKGRLNSEKTGTSTFLPEQPQVDNDTIYISEEETPSPRNTSPTSSPPPLYVQNPLLVSTPPCVFKTRSTRRRPHLVRRGSSVTTKGGDLVFAHTIPTNPCITNPTYIIFCM